MPEVELIRLALVPPEVRAESLRLAHQMAVLLRSDSQLAEDLGTCPAPADYSAEQALNDAEDWCRRTNGQTYVIVHGETVVGSISLSPAKEGLSMGRIGYFMGSAWRRRGYMTQAFSQMLSIARIHGLRSVTGRLDKDNLPSLRLWQHHHAVFEETEDEVRGFLDLHPPF